MPYRIRRFGLALLLASGSDLQRAGQRRQFSLQGELLGEGGLGHARKKRDFPLGLLIQDGFLTKNADRHPACQLPRSTN